MRTVLLFLVAMLAGRTMASQTTISLKTDDGAVVYADLYGAGERAVVLVHGGQFNKESWAPQARILVEAGYRVMAIDLRGFGQSHGPGDKDIYTAPHYLDVLAAVRYLHRNGAKTVSVVGGSMGGSAAGDACIASRPGEIHRLVLLGASPNMSAAGLKAPVLFMLARDDASGDGPRLPGIQKQYDLAPQPKELILLNGSAHAQHLFETDQGERVMKEILRFLSAR
jgi:pimeloyl-ACP methyl ester carboxylesterase